MAGVDCLKLVEARPKENLQIKRYGGRRSSELPLLVDRSLGD